MARIKVSATVSKAYAQEVASNAKRGDVITIAKDVPEEIEDIIVIHAPIGVVITHYDADGKIVDTIIGEGQEEEEDMREEVVHEEPKVKAFGKEAFVTGKEKVSHLFTKIKEEKKMEFNYKEGLSNGWEAVKEGASKLKAFIKKHAGKAVLGLTTLTLAGTVTSGLGSALVVGTTLYAAIAAAYEFIKAKKEQRAADRDALVDGLGDALLYGTVGAMSMYCLAGVLVGVLGSIFAYSYVGFTYLAYFIVA